MTSWRKWQHKLHLVSRWLDSSSVDRHIANGNFNCRIVYSYWNVTIWSRRFWSYEKPIHDSSRQLHCLRCFRIWKSNMWVAPRGFLSYFSVSWWRRISLAWNDFWPYNFSYKCLVHGSGILIVVNCYFRATNWSFRWVQFIVFFSCASNAHCQQRTSVTRKQGCFWPRT